MLFFKTITITVLCSVAVAVTGAPTVVESVLDARSNETYVSPRTSSTKERFIVPTVQYFVNRMKNLVPPNKSLFFSGPGDYEFKARMYAHENGLNVLVDFTDPLMTEAASNAGGAVLKEYWHRVSEAYSEVTVGKTYVLLPGDPSILKTTWQKGTIWDQVEWPVLEKNRYVPEVLRINPSMTLAEAINIKD